MNDIPNAVDPAIEELEDELDSALAKLALYENVGGESLPIAPLTWATQTS